MRCKQVIRSCSAYLDGELTFEDEDRINEHLAGCLRCRGEYARMRGALDLLGELGAAEAVDPGEEFDRLIMARIRTEVPARREAERSPLRERAWQRVASMLLPKPALAMGASLVLGLAVGAGVHELMTAAGEAEAGRAGLERVRAGTGAPVGATSAAGMMADSRTAGVSEPERGAPGDSAPVPGPEYVIDPYVVRDELQPVVEPIFPLRWQETLSPSSEDVYITF